MIICPRELCTGCMACLNVCPRKAIARATDEKGFDIPAIDERACTRCGQCQRICPVNRPAAKNESAAVALACWVEDAGLRQNSTSGGLFSVLATHTLARKGVVFGAAFDGDWNVAHTAVTTPEELGRLRGSKYVQSQMGDSYRAAERLLKDGTPVLFSGTSCQIAGLYAYLGKPDDNLTTIDVLCHCAPSPMFYRDYLRSICEGEKKKITQIRFRYKKPGWTVFSMRIDFAAHTPYQADAFSDPYLCAFLKDYISRDCCQTCPYADTRRVADITLADFWGYVSPSKAQRNTEEGISLALINNTHGAALFSAVQSQLVLVPKTLREALKGNTGFQTPHSHNSGAAAFWHTYLQTRNFDWAVQTIGKRKLSVRHRAVHWMNDHSYSPLLRAVKRMYRAARGKQDE